MYVYMYVYISYMSLRLRSLLGCLQPFDLCRGSHLPKWARPVDCLAYMACVAMTDDDVDHDHDNDDHGDDHDGDGDDDEEEDDDDYHCDHCYHCSFVVAVVFRAVFLSLL